MSILDVDDVIEVLDRIRAENESRSAENESRRMKYEKIASTLCGRKISVNFTSDIGPTHTGAEGIGSADRSSIVIKWNLGRVTEHSVFCHELVHAYLEHSPDGGDHTANLKELVNALPESKRESFRVEIDRKEIDAERLGPILHEAFWPDETWVL